MANLPQKASAPANTYNKRFRWWYAAIADWMLVNPGRKQSECAEALGKHYNTISMIMNSDMFKAYFAERRAQFEETHHAVLNEKLTHVAEASLDILIEQINKKRDAIPIGKILEVATSALDRLGYAPGSGPTTQINVQSNGGQVAIAPVAVDRLEEARAIMRRAQENRRTDASSYLPPPRVLEQEPEDDALHLASEQ